MLKEITLFEFEEFAKKSKLGTFYQTHNYAIFKSEDNFDYDYLGFFQGNTLVGAAMILVKKITLTTKYAYSPRGFLIDYEDLKLVLEFSLAIKRYYSKKRVVFIKIDPPVILKSYNNSKNLLNQNYNHLKNELEYMGFKKLKDNLFFESLLPRFEAIVDLKNTATNNYYKNTRNKINKAKNKGLSLELVKEDKIPVIYEFFKKKYRKKITYFNNLFKVFNTDNMIDLYLVKVDYEKFMENAKSAYEEELVINNEYNERLKLHSSSKNLNKKMKSDKRLVSYKNEIMDASRKYTDNELQIYVAGAIVIKYNNTATILYSGYNSAYRHLACNYFLYHQLIENYKNDFEYLNLGEITGDFNHENKYYGLNEFKCSFNPILVEYIGELDFILNSKVYNNLLITGKLHDELDKKIKEG